MGERDLRGKGTTPRGQKVRKRREAEEGEEEGEEGMKRMGKKK